MPAFRNVQSRRSSGRIWNKAPIAYDEYGWETDPATLVFSRSQMISSPHSTATSPSTASVDSDFEAPVPVRKNKGKGKATGPGHVPRPKNAFIFFRSYFYQTLGGNDQNQISVAAGKAWKALPLEEKRLHQINHPDYTYAPGFKGGAPKRKAAPKRKTQPSAKSTLVPQLRRCASRRMSIAHISIHRREQTPPQVAIPTLLSPLAGKDIQPVSDLTYEEPQVPEDIFNPAWSFVPTSEIPPLELSPPKAEKSLYDLSLRPSSYDCINHPAFQSYAATIPATVESFFAGSQPEVSNFDYFDLPSYDFHLTQCTPLEELWRMDASAALQGVAPEASYGTSYTNSIPTNYTYDTSYGLAPEEIPYAENSSAPAPASAFSSPNISELEMQWMNYCD
ncbi:hypothetical protein DXG03_002427 [Asterophora parasitica]|uniref:HMG box domain-containing protein n=1 Tax=Asterophora parasitica TaxID=117018 RepID=A0A9P7GCD3_9AGAR|nr:hypothetical protein DXG03_002427 [Asterophora parasitica]